MHCLECNSSVIRLSEIRILSFSTSYLLPGFRETNLKTAIFCKELSKSLQNSLSTTEPFRMSIPLCIVCVTCTIIFKIHWEGNFLRVLEAKKSTTLAEQRQESVVLIFEYQVNGWNIYKKNHREVEGCVKISKEKPIFNKIVISFLLRVLISQ